MLLNDYFPLDHWQKDKTFARAVRLCLAPVSCNWWRN
jgi:hypothetical protein